MKIYFYSMAIIFYLFSFGAFAVNPNEMLANPELEQRARAISMDLRCLVCQNQSIDDSDAELAHDLRLLVRQRIASGDSDAQVKQYIVSRYGNYVLLKPPFKANTVVLWLSPLFFLLMAIILVALFYSRRKKAALYDAAADMPLSAGEQSRIACLIARTEAKQ